MVWYSLPVGHGFIWQKINPGHVYSHVHFDMDSSKQTTHAGLKVSFICLFHASKKARMGWNGSLKLGKGSPYVLCTSSISLNRRPDIISPRWKWGPSNISSSDGFCPSKNAFCDHPRQLPPLPYSNQGGKTVALRLRMTKPIWNKGQILILDSGFCVLNGIVALAKKGVFASALIKKKRYWPKYIKGEEIKEH